MDMLLPILIIHNRDNQLFVSLSIFYMTIANVEILQRRHKQNVIHQRFKMEYVSIFHEMIIIITCGTKERSIFTCGMRLAAYFVCVKICKSSEWH